MVTAVTGGQLVSVPWPDLKNGFPKGIPQLFLVAHVFFNVGLAVRVIGAVWGQLDGRLGEVAASLGASAFARFRLITWPLLRPAITAASVLVFMFTFTSFGVVLVVGDPALPTIEVEIYQRAIQRLDLDAGLLDDRGLPLQPV